MILNFRSYWLHNQAKYTNVRRNKLYQASNFNSTR